MAYDFLFANNATTTLAESISATATVLNVATGDGALFPSPSSGQAFAVTLVDAATGLTNEICYCTSRSGDALTVIRGQEGKNAVAWSAGDTCANYITADVIESWLQEVDLDGYATESWSNGQFLQLADGSNQTVTGPVTYSGNVTHNGTETFNGTTTVPDISSFTGANAVNARTADNRYAKLNGGNTFSGTQTINGLLTAGLYGSSGNSNILYGAQGRVSFQTDQNFVVYNGSTAILSISSAKFIYRGTNAEFTGTATFDGTTTVPDVTDWTSYQAVPAKDADARYATLTDLANETSNRENADNALQTDINEAVSGTLGVISANGDKAATGLHIDGATGKPSIVYDGGTGDIAWESDVTSEASARESADNNLQSDIDTRVSGTLGVVSSDNDKQGTGLHLDGATGNASFVYDGGSGDLAWQSTLTAEVEAREAATSTLQTNIDACVSGTLGVLSSDNDKQGLGLHLDGATGNPSFAYDGGTGDIAWQSTVTAEVARAKAAEATAVSGTLGVISGDGDKQGTGLHYDGATGNPSFSYDGGSGDVAWQSSLDTETSAREAADTTLQDNINDCVSGTLGVISGNGDKQGTGLHYDGSTGHASFSYSGGTIDLAPESDVTAEASAREAADETLQTDIDTRVSGTLGVVSSNGDIAATGLHVDGATGHANVVTASETLDLTSYSGFAIAPTLYTGSTTITVPKGVSIALIKAIGGGGSGCSCEGSSLSTSSYGAGGAAGGYVYFSIAVSNGDTIDLTIGAGASSPTNTVNGQTNGGDTIVTHNGAEVARGSGGTGGVWNSASSCAGGTGGGATTQNGANPIEYSNGTDGGDGQTGAESIASVTGYGAPGVWGGGGRAGNGGGQAGTGFGAGGGGAYDTSYSSTFYGGGAGHAGCVTVEFK